MWDRAEVPEDTIRRYRLVVPALRELLDFDMPADRKTKLTEHVRDGPAAVGYSHGAEEAGECSHSNQSCNIRCQC